MKELLTFDDVLITPKFSFVDSRKYVNPSFVIGSAGLSCPIISANMDTVTGVEMAKTMWEEGAIGALHRFSSIEQNVADYKEVASYRQCLVSVGIGSAELERAKALYAAGARMFILDVAHGASKAAANMYMILKAELLDIILIVGNFATGESCSDFRLAVHPFLVDGFKIGIGSGSICSTRLKTGCGVPQLSAVMDVARTVSKWPNKPILISDGGISKPADMCKALAAGADLVMMGSAFAGADESPGDFVWIEDKIKKKYRGSASKESYQTQGKTSDYITAEGTVTYIDSKGPVKNIINDYMGGLRSSMSYVGAFDLKEYQSKAEFAKISPAAYRESLTVGKE